ncbi:SDR family NAD(P)-dependent oxidoreductase [Anaeroarcus burkinensis]|uniref:SDR family NAD(P)-dependent oxidoreductase n=1 Tax=Anaeroarcus burkinensis TaxID=82376 RepID=UPI00040350BB|nr:SDR family oxidoreductase [Anaeroarcus burkinensis]
MDYTGKIVLVTGGANGIGETISRAYVQAGATVVIADIDEAKGQILAQEERIIFYALDLTKETAIQGLFRFLAETYRKIDILINNAGKSCFKPIETLSVEEWDEVLHLNLRASFITAQEFAKLHRQGTYGRIINIASTRYLMSEPHSEAYAASKGGLVALTHALALSLSSKELTVNAISPGWIETRSYENLTAADHGQHPAGRVGRPEDIAQACLFLSDAENSFITGQNLVIDGGMTKKMIYME